MNILFFIYRCYIYMLFNLTFVVFSVLQLNKTNWVSLCVRTLFPSFQFSSCLKCPPLIFWAPLGRKSWLRHCVAAPKYRDFASENEPIHSGWQDFSQSDSVNWPPLGIFILALDFSGNVQITVCFYN